jgi:prolipoprotein diacylglyceryltransferase
MSDELFVGLLSGVLLAVLVWGFRTLPGERWQILAVLPKSKREDLSWNGLNLTYYGFFTANAYALSVAVVMLLLGSLSMPWESILLLTITLLGLCIPASRFIAWIVEKKKHTMTVGGASFVGILTAPWVVWIMNETGDSHLNGMAICAALCIAYVFGEGLGRLACISFGCCYGKPLSDVHPMLRRLFTKWHFVFSGPLKKSSYASGFEGNPVVPVQAMTALLYTATGLIGIYLFLKESYLVAFLLSLVISQLWRVVSELLRADHRGTGTLSAYQWMALLSIPYSMLAIQLFPIGLETTSRLNAGLDLLWNPVSILLLQVFWFTTFLWTGQSSVTGATVSLYVHKDRI